MKKTIITTAIILGLGLGGYAQSLFQKQSEEFDGGNRTQNQNTPMLVLPTEHGSTSDATSVPTGSGIAVLVGLGAAYLFGKKRREE